MTYSRLQMTQLAWAGAFGYFALSLQRFFWFGLIWLEVVVVVSGVNRNIIQREP